MTPANCGRRAFDFTDAADVYALGVGLVIGALLIILALWIGRRCTRP